MRKISFSLVCFLLAVLSRGKQAFSLSFPYFGPLSTCASPSRRQRTQGKRSCWGRRSLTSYRSCGNRPREGIKLGSTLIRFKPSIRQPAEGKGSCWGKRPLASDFPYANQLRGKDQVGADGHLHQIFHTPTGRGEGIKLGQTPTCIRSFMRQSASGRDQVGVHIDSL